MARDKKDFDYWDKYYGNKKSTGTSGNRGMPDSRRSAYDGRRYPNEDTASRSTSRSSRLKRDRNEKYESKIVGSEYKVKKRKRKSGASRAVIMTILIIAVFFLGFFTFYAVDNELFSKKSGESASGSTDSAGSKSLEETIQKENLMSSLSIESDSSQTGKESVTESESSTSQPAGNSGENNTKEPLSFFQKVIMFFKSITGRDDSKDDYPERLHINVYFAMLGNEEMFNAEKRTIVAGSIKNAAVNAVNELLKGPAEEYNFAVIPPGTKLMDVEIANDIARINLSQEFLSNSLDTDILDEYIVYTIVNTLTEIKEIRAVVFFINGKEIKEYGNVDLRLPAIRNEKYLEKS